MDKSKIVTTAAAVLGLIGVFLLVRVFMAEGNEAIDSATSAIVTYSKILLIITAVLAIVFSVLNLLKHPAALKKSLLGLVVLGVLLAIAYFTASGDAVTDSVGAVLKDGEAGAVSKWVSALINFTGILGLAGILLILLGFGRSFIK